jgi:hypothetical protein
LAEKASKKKRLRMARRTVMPRPPAWQWQDDW